MIGGVTVKICGLTSLKDAECAAECGADYLGFIFHEASPRNVRGGDYAAMIGRLPDRPRVAVLVEPTAEALKGFAALGFDRFQVHFQPDEQWDRLGRWADAVGIERLWLAPKLPPGALFPEGLLRNANTFLLDGYKPDQYGGTGLNSDWDLFRRLQETHANRTWILSGGLSPANIARALAETGTSFIDLNSGVESAPGVKDPQKLQALATALGALRPAT